MTSFSKVPHLTVDEYLEQELHSDVRHEYLDGQLFAMTGESAAHNVICGSFYTVLRQYLKGSGCSVFINGLKVRIESSNCFYYPDIVVTCQPFDAASLFAHKPTLIAEVLSESTKRVDRREKFIAYKSLPSLQEYLLIHQTRQRIELFRKSSSGEWEICVFSKFDTLILSSLQNFEVPVSAVYDGVEFSPTVKEEDESEYELSIF